MTLNRDWHFWNNQTKLDAYHSEEDNTLQEIAIKWKDYFKENVYHYCEFMCYKNIWL